MRLLRKWHQHRYWKRRRREHERQQNPPVAASEAQIRAAAAEYAPVYPPPIVHEPTTHVPATGLYRRCDKCGLVFTIAKGLPLTVLEFAIRDHKERYHA